MTTYRIFFYIPLVLLVGLLLFHGTEVVHYLDVSILKAVQRRPTALLDDLGILLSVAGAPFASVLFIGALCLVFLKRRKLKQLFLFLTLFVVLTGFEYTAKVHIYHPRPGEEYLRKIKAHAFFRNLPDVSIPGNNSFPSGHCLRAVFLTGILAILLWRHNTKDRTILLIAVGAYWFVAAWSRVYLGAHWPSDVLGGCILGILGLVVYSRAVEMGKCPPNGIQLENSHRCS